MTSITISHEEHPEIKDLQLGDQVTITISGLVHRIEAQADISGYARAEHVVGAAETEILVSRLKIEPRA